MILENERTQERGSYAQSTSGTTLLPHSHSRSTDGRRRARTLLDPRTLEVLTTPELPALRRDATLASPGEARQVRTPLTAYAPATPASAPQKSGIGRIVLLGSGLAALAVAIVAMMAWGSPRSGASAMQHTDSSSAAREATSAPDVAPQLADASQATIVTSSIEGRSVVTFAGHLTGAVSLAWSPDNRTIALGSSDKAVRLLDTQTGEVQGLLGHTDIVYNVAWSQDGKTLASAGTDKSVRLWSVDGRSTEPIATLAGHPEAVSGLAWLPGGEMLASISAGSEGIELIHWDTEGMRIGDSLKHKSGGGSLMTSVTWSSDARLFAGGFNDGSIRIWSSQGELLSTLQGHTDGVYTVAWSPAGNTIASGGNDKTVRLWNADGKLLADLSGHTDFVNSVAWSPDGRTLASAGDGAVRLWSATGTPTATLSHGNMKPLFVAWSPDGKKLASLTSDSTLWVWNLP